MSRGSRGSLLLALFVLVVAAVVVALRFEATTDISAFLPSGSDREKAKISKAVAGGEASRTIMVTIEADSAAAAAEISRAFEAEVRADADLIDALDFFEAGPPKDIDRGLWELYHPRRLAFTAGNGAQAQAMLTPAGLDAAVADLKRRLASPLSTLISQSAPEDPFLAIPRFFERIQTQRSASLSTVDGRFIAQERFAVFIVGTHASAFDAAAQVGVFEGLAAAHARLPAGAGAMETSGVARFSIRAERTIKADIQRTTILSIIGLFVLCLVVLRSFRLVALTLVPIGSAMLVATAVTLLLFGSVHGLTFAFGASLIGVCVDYVVHYYVHHAVVPGVRDPWRTMSRIWPALALGAATTAVGFAVIAGSSFPGLRQVSIFASVGVLAALLSTRALLPYLVGPGGNRSALRDRLAQFLAARFHRLQQHRGGAWALLALTITAAGWGIATVEWNDDLSEMNRLDPEMLAEDERVRERVARFDQGRFIIALGETEQKALEVNDKVGDALREATVAAELGGWHGVSTLLPSAARQREIDAAVRGQASLRSDLEAALERGGFNADLFAPFHETLAEPAPPPLTFDDVAGSPAASLVRSLRMEVDGKIGFVSVVRNVTDPAALEARVGQVDGAVFIDQTAIVASAMGEYRRRTVQLLGVGLLAVLALLGFRYRSARTVAAVITPALLAAGATVAALSLAGLPLNLVGLTAILMILSIGVDYGVFLAETGTESDDELSATLLGLVVCWSTTVLGFGVLALSDHPMMNMIGIVAGVGVTASLLLAPTTLALLPRREAKS